MMREQYGISFEKVRSKSGLVFPYASENNINNAEIAHHITCSDESATEMQILELQKALAGEKIQAAWGEVMGSTLDIQSDGTVQINYTNRRIPIQDFKELLEEWLHFITT